MKSLFASSTYFKIKVGKLNIGILLLGGTHKVKLREIILSAMHVLINIYY